MPKAKGKTRRQKFGYSVNRKRLNRNARRKAAPRIECSHIRHAWDHAKSVRQNLAEMGLAVDPNRAVPLRKRKVKAMEVDIEERPKGKPYVLNDLEAEASLPEKKGNTLSRDLIDYVRYMVENHGEDYKRSGKTSSILCGRVRWRSSDWFTSQLPQAEVSPGPVKLEPGCKARRCCVAPEGLARSHGIRRLHTHVEGTVLRGSNLYSSGGSRKSQNLMFSG
uniref:Nucleolar protein 16 n=1 Tax=Nomascus leucogenys TaxID=61853 RepID=A0A2I3GZD1_NOMLE